MCCVESVVCGAGDHYLRAMPRFLLGWILGLGANAIALLVCKFLLPGFTLTWDGFVVALVVFAVLSGIFTWFTFKFLLRNAGSLVALTGLVSTFLALVATSVFTQGLDIDGTWTWVWATLIIWVISMFIWVLPGPWRHFKKDDRA